LLAAILTLVLAAIAALHAYWGFGGVWPGRDAADCARRVGGFRGARTMPGAAACFAVAAAIAIAGAIPIIILGPSGMPASALPALAGLAVALIFLARGIAGFTPAWRRYTPEQPFARLDVRYYSPLCLVIGAGFAALAIKELLP
jgi:uncharacterized protein DUF3995